MIEDDLELAEILTEFLEQYDFTVTTEDDPFKALSILKLEKFDAVILDLTLPGMDGLEVCEAVVLAVRIQEVFGLSEHPSVMEGKIPLLVHLLSPARRPIQVTRDLVGFWNGSYTDVKKELKGRYPKHYWPDDPRNAEATSRTKKYMGS